MTAVVATGPMVMRADSGSSRTVGRGIEQGGGSGWFR